MDGVACWVYICFELLGMGGMGRENGGGMGWGLEWGGWGWVGGVENGNGKWKMGGRLEFD